jgi:bacterioferritin
MLEIARQMEEDSAHDYYLWANERSANTDAVLKKLFDQLVADEERHYDQYDVEVETLKKFGDCYRALQSIERSKNHAGGMVEG